MPEIDLERFLEDYRLDHHQALSEINSGRKRSHWMWYIFPQIAGLGSSPTAAVNAIRSRAEAAASSKTRRSRPSTAAHRRRLAPSDRAQSYYPGAVRPARRPEAGLVLTLFAGVAAGLGDDWTTAVAEADEILTAPPTKGSPRAATQRFLAADA
jgi:Protein of unknown function (DUF1810)